MKHDCRKIEERLIDLVFDELNDEERKQTLAEVESCEPCRSEYLSFRQTLSAYDEAAASMMSDENYWNGYEARLRVKLAADERPNVWQRLREAISVLTTRPAWAMSLALLLWLTLLIGVLLTQTDYKPQPTQQAEDKPSVTAPNEDKDKEKERLAESLEGGDEQKKSFPQEPDSLHKKPSVRRPKNALPVTARTVEKELVNQAPSAIAATGTPADLTGAVLADDDTRKHFEKAQIFLRSFRNLNAAENDSAFEIVDDKKRSQTLLFKNVLLRREAEAKGNRPVEQVLSDLEPLLLDIANLSDQATSDEIRAIRERLQKREMIATLQVYVAPPVIARANTD